MTTFSQQVATVIRGMLAEQDITQTHVARELDRAQSYVSDRVRGTKSWTTSDLDVIATLLDMTAAELLREVLARTERDREQMAMLRSGRRR